MYQKVTLKLTKAQVAKLVQGKSIQLTAAQLKGNNHFLMLHPSTVQKVGGAMKKNKGIRITMTPHELEMSGEGIKEFLEKIKQGAKFIKDKVIDSEFYQKNVKPLAREAVNQGVDLLSKRIPMSAAAQNAIRGSVDKLGQVTNAYGVKRGRPRKLKIDDSSSSFLGPEHPAMNPTMPTLPAIGGACCEKCGHKGGSFRLS